MKWYMELGESHTEANGWSARKVKEWTTNTHLKKKKKKKRERDKKHNHPRKFTTG